ncbi:MAG: Na/Pi cotransporter family protein, partial [Oscillospiraceae bacterium]|nr:Na/Pi cotransporter family protein [Oscillospiraceae bacterium]
ERISDHAVHLVQSVEELHDKKTSFSPEAQEEIAILRKAIAEILELTRTSFKDNNLELATHIEPLEQVVDKLVDRIKLNHVLRLQKSECTIEHGFVLSDLLIYFERISDHCSNIGGCIIEISEYNAMDMHKYMAAVHHGSEDYEQMYNEYKYKYSV